MMEYQVEEREISLKRMAFFCLHQWRRILAAAVILALVMGGFRAAQRWHAMSDPDVLAKNDQEYELAMQQYRDEKASLEAQVESLQNTIGNQQEYMDKSVLMAIDPYNFYRGTLSVCVDVKDNTMTSTILLAYQAALNSGDLLSGVAQEMGMEEKYLRELVTVSVDTSAETLNNLLTVSVAYASQEGAQQLLDLIEAGIDTLSQQLSERVGSHKINVVVCSVSSCVDMNISLLQKTELENQSAQLKLLETAQSQLEALDEPGENILTVKSVVKSGIKYAAAGGVIGAFLVLVMAVLSFILSDKLYSGDELKAHYNITVLASILPKGRKFRGLDAWLNRAEGRGVGCESEYDLAAANIRNYAGSAKKILVTSTAGDAASKALTEALGDKTGLELVACGSLLQDPAALVNLAACDAVVMVEKCWASHYGPIGVALERISDAGKPLLGCVIEEV